MKKKQKKIKKQINESSFRFKNLIYNEYFMNYELYASA